jgi:glc operon protein GlcG
MLTLAEANQAIAAALARAQNMKMKIAVSVCDEGGRLVAFQRMDGVFSESIPLAIGKAIAAAASTKSRPINN